MGIRSILKKKGDGDSDEDRSQSPTNGFFQYQNQNQNQNQYQNLSQNPYQDEYRDQYQSQQQSPSYHHHQQQQQRGGPPPRPPPPAESLQTPEFTFIRSDTFTQEVIHPPSWPANSSNGNGNGNLDNLEEEEGGGDGRNHLQIHELPATPVVSPRGRNFDVFRRSSHSSRSASSQRGDQEKDNENHHDQLEPEKPAKDKDLHRLSRKLSARLHLHRSSGAAASTHVPANLPEIVVPEGEGGTAADAALALSGGGGAAAGATSPTAAAAAATSAKNKKPPPANPAIESQWEKRATLLALENEKRHIYNTAAAASLSRPTTPEKGKRRGRSASSAPAISPAAVATASAAATVRSQQQNGGSNTKPNDVSSKELDATIQEAIRLHEEGQLEESTRLFGILADPRGHNNPLSQVLYGLALRHGWGCEPDTEAAVTYLSAAASNAAAVEELALQAGLKRGGAAKGELVLAIFELANCFRHGWGLEKDPIAAKQYYETAANLGDTDAMNEVAWCYLEGFGCKKDKFAASRYYRLAEQNGNKTLGNTWIWKEKYDPEKQKPKKK